MLRYYDQRVDDCVYSIPLSPNKNHGFVGLVAPGYHHLVRIHTILLHTVFLVRCPHDALRDFQVLVGYGDVTFCRSV